ncbi:hypothetical protein H4219_006189 [Mycoemilia scoparia]|uniref:Thioredoxin domain-containing protein n=1 Tax=Mycoemilia scoparia TaxID=417184 RepID=A0A9W8DJE8_9FUNG|nr:hypothetical protein H4219_006189 [Mycoemilia scoparia]
MMFLNSVQLLFAATATAVTASAIPQPLEAGAKTYNAGINLSITSAISNILTPSNFTEALGIEAGAQWLIKFYSPTCPYSKRLAPVWEEFAKTCGEDAVSKNIYIGEVDCKANGYLCQQNDISGYPTVLYFKDGQPIQEVINDRTFVEYDAFLKQLY